MFDFLIFLQSTVTEVPQAPDAPLHQVVLNIDYRKCSMQLPCKGEAQDVAYQISSPATADFKAGEPWVFSVDKDDFSDKRTCVLRTERSIGRTGFAEIFITLYNDSPNFDVYHRDEAFPGTNELYRVDENTVISKREGAVMPNPKSDALLRQMKAGNILRVAYVKWPTRDRESSEIDLTGFSAIYRAANALCNKA